MPDSLKQQRQRVGYFRSRFENIREELDAAEAHLELLERAQNEWIDGGYNQFGDCPDGATPTPTPEPPPPPPPDPEPPPPEEPEWPIGVEPDVPTDFTHTFDASDNLAQRINGLPPGSRILVRAGEARGQTIHQPSDSWLVIEADMNGQGAARAISHDDRQLCRVKMRGNGRVRNYATPNKEIGAIGTEPARGVDHVYIDVRIEDIRALDPNMDLKGGTGLRASRGTRAFRPRAYRCERAGIVGVLDGIHVDEGYFEDCGPPANSPITGNAEHGAIKLLVTKASSITRSEAVRCSGGFWADSLCAVDTSYNVVRECPTFGIFHEANVGGRAIGNRIYNSGGTGGWSSGASLWIGHTHGSVDAPFIVELNEIYDGGNGLLLFNQKRGEQTVLNHIVVRRNRIVRPGSIAASVVSADDIWTPWEAMSATPPTIVYSENEYVPHPTKGLQFEAGRKVNGQWAPQSSWTGMSFANWKTIFPTEKQVAA